MSTKRKPTGLKETINMTSQFQRNSRENKEGSFTEHEKKVAYDEGSYY